MICDLMLTSWMTTAVDISGKSEKATKTVMKASLRDMPAAPVVQSEGSVWSEPVIQMGMSGVDSSAPELAVQIGMPTTDREAVAPRDPRATQEGIFLNFHVHIFKRWDRWDLQHPRYPSLGGRQLGPTKEYFGGNLDGLSGQVHFQNSQISGNMELLSSPITDFCENVGSRWVYTAWCIRNADFSGFVKFTIIRL